jgi:hypothetical protein
LLLHGEVERKFSAAAAVATITKSFNIVFCNVQQSVDSSKSWQTLPSITHLVLE